jgi:hypothetical protein
VLLIVGELAEIIERRLKMRRLDCPYIFHADGRPIGDFRKRWRKGARPSGFPVVSSTISGGAACGISFAPGCHHTP